MLIDCHMHLFPSAEQGEGAVADFPIVEYGPDPGVARSARAGTFQDGLDALAAAGADHACVLNSFDLPGSPLPPGDAWPPQPPHPEHAPALRAYNEWVCELGARHPQLLPFVTIHPGVLGAEEAAAHVVELAERGGARGVKLHTIGLRAHPGEAALGPTFAACAERGLPVVAHCGPDRHGAGWAMPEAFAPVLERHPRLPLVLAHLGGGAWEQIAAFAARFPAARFDLSEIVSWTGAPGAPTARQLGELIAAVGAERVLLGSDFPWYEPADAAAAVRALPGLTQADRDAILGANAARLLGLD